MTGDSLQNLRIRVVPGPGLVAVLDDVLLVVPAIEPRQEPTLDALLAAAGSASPERAVARVVADFDEDLVPPFCLVAPGEVTGLFALVHGEMELSAEGTEGGARLRGREARTWVDRTLPGGLQRLAVTVGSPAELEPDPYVDLRSGIVRGGGVLMTRRDDSVADRAGLASEAEAGPPPQADTPKVDTPSVADIATPASEPSAAWSTGTGEDRARAAGFRPEPIRFGQGGRIEPLDPALRPVNGHDGRGRRAAVPAATASGPGERVDPAAAEPAVSAPVVAGPAAAPASGSAGDSAGPPATPGPPTTPGAVPAEATGQGPAFLDVTTTFAAARSDRPGDRPAGDAPAAVDAPAGDAPAAVDAPAGETALSGEAHPGGPDRAVEALAGDAGPGPGPASVSEENPFSTRTQIVPPPVPGRGAGVVAPPPAAIDPFGMPAPVAPMSPVAQPAPPAPIAPLALVSPVASLTPVPISPASITAPPGDRGDLLGDPAQARPGRGRLVIENGPDVLVDRDCVIGRNPEVDPDVAQGRARAVTLADAEQRISRVHARLLITEAGVEIVDTGSVNGTWIEPPGSVGWIAMVPRVPAPLPLGSRIQVGDLVLAYEPAALA